MSKIIFHKNGHQHEPVAKAKWMLNKIEDQFEDILGSFYCKIQLTGINEIDKRQVKIYVGLHLNVLKKQIDELLLLNEEFGGRECKKNYDDDYFVQSARDQLELIKALGDVYRCIEKNYPYIDLK